MENVADFELLRIFKEALRFEKLTNSDAKGTTRSVKMWDTNFFVDFSKKYLSVNELQAVNIFFHYILMLYTEWFILNDIVCMQC